MIYTLGEVSKDHVETKPDKAITVLEVISQIASKKSDLSNVVILRSMPPTFKKDQFLLLRVDVRKMIMTGNTRFIVIVGADDLIYVA